MHPRWLLAVGLLGAAGCVRREVPYHFHGAMVGAIQPEPREIEPAPPPIPRAAPPRTRPPITAAAVRLAEAPPASFSLARPVRRGPAAPGDLAGRLREQVGRRRADDSLAFALAMIAGARHRELDPAVARLADPAALVALARARHAELPEPAPRTGDLVVFGPLAEPTALVAIAVGTAASGTIEFVYLARGVVRRGFATPGRPDTLRDADGRVLNTMVRGYDGRDPRDTRYVAGQLLAAAIDGDRLLGERAPLVGRR
jgi:hypothetical protein